MTTVDSARALPGPYTDLVEVGRGGSSTVYRARSAAFERDVAIKVFHGTVDDTGLQARFRRECRVLGSLGDHPHVVSVFDSGFTADRRPFIVMPHCSGGSLGQRLVGQGPRPVEETVTVGLAVADALAAAHARGVVHRDVKPHNVLLTAYGVVTLADFGVAAAGPVDLTSLAATPGYTAPEVIVDHRAVGPASDLYALGATLFALLTGGPPARQAPHEADVAFMLRCIDEPTPALPPHVPAPIAAVIRACLAKEPESRPASAQQVLLDLKLAAVRSQVTPPARLPLLPLPASVAPSWRPDSAPEISGDLDTQDAPLVRPRRRGPVLAAAAVLAVGVAGVLGALAAGPESDPDSPSPAPSAVAGGRLPGVTPSMGVTGAATATSSPVPPAAAGDLTGGVTGELTGGLRGSVSDDRAIDPANPAARPAPVVPSATNGPGADPIAPVPTGQAPGPDPTTAPTTAPTTPVDATPDATAAPGQGQNGAKPAKTKKPKDDDDGGDD